MQGTVWSAAIAAALLAGGVARAAPVNVDPWAANATVVKGSELDALFWPLFDDLAQKKQDEAIVALKKAQPATWQIDEKKVRAKAAADRKAGLAALKARTHLYRFEARLPTYDPKRRGFLVDLPGRWVEAQPFAPRWTLLVGKKAVVTTKAEVQFNQPIEKLSYEFAGGSRLQWLVKVPLAEADAFMQANGRFNAPAALQAEVLLRVDGAVRHPDQPAYRFGRDAPNWVVDPMRGHKANAGRALLTRMVGWRLKDKDGRIVAEGK
jgi:hypothetical protein